MVSLSQFYSIGDMTMDSGKELKSAISLIKNTKTVTMLDRTMNVVLRYFNTLEEINMIYDAYQEKINEIIDKSTD